MIRNILSKALLVSVVSIGLVCVPKPAWAQRGGGGFHGGGGGGFRGGGGGFHAGFSGGGYRGGFGGGSHAGPGPVYPGGASRSAPYTLTQRTGPGRYGGPGGAYGSHVYTRPTNPGGGRAGANTTAGNRPEAPPADGQWHSFASRPSPGSATPQTFVAGDRVFAAGGRSRPTGPSGSVGGAPLSIHNSFAGAAFGNGSFGSGTSLRQSSRVVAQPAATELGFGTGLRNMPLPRFSGSLSGFGTAGFRSQMGNRWNGFGFAGTRFGQFGYPGRQFGCWVCGWGGGFGLGWGIGRWGLGFGWPWAGYYWDPFWYDSWWDWPSADLYAYPSPSYYSDTHLTAGASEPPDTGTGDYDSAPVPQRDLNHDLPSQRTPWRAGFLSPAPRHSNQRVLVLHFADIPQSGMDCQRTLSDIEQFPC